MDAFVPVSIRLPKCSYSVLCDKHKCNNVEFISGIIYRFHIEKRVCANADGNSQVLKSFIPFVRMYLIDAV